MLQPASPVISYTTSGNHIGEAPHLNGALRRLYRLQVCHARPPQVLPVLDEGLAVVGTEVGVDAVVDGEVELASDHCGVAILGLGKGGATATTASYC